MLSVLFLPPQTIYKKGENDPKDISVSLYFLKWKKK